MNLKLALSLGALVAVVAALLFGASQHNRAERLQVKVDNQATCVKSIKLAPRADLPSGLCAPAIAVAVIAAQGYVSCNSALDGGDLFAIRATCSTPVKTLLAERDAARTERDGAKRDLNRTRKEQPAVIARAATRARTQVQKEVQAHAAISAAPRDSDGLSVCSDQCLRNLSRGRPQGPTEPRAGR